MSTIQTTMIHHELDTLQTALNTALNCLRSAMDKSELPPLSQHAVDMHPLDRMDYLAPIDVYEARRTALGMFLCLAPIQLFINSSC